jgi:hypothetical protein
VRRLGKLEVGFWLETSGDFLRVQKQFSNILRFDFPYSFRNQNPQRKSAIQIHKEFQEFLIFKQAKFRAKKKEMSWSKWEF